MKNRLLIIRAESNEQIGTGHVMRCLALAQAWKHNGGSVNFCCDISSMALLNRLDQEGYKNISPASCKFLSLSGKVKMPIHPKNNATWVILDGITFSTDYQKDILNAGYKLLVIDDTNKLSSQFADILVNPNYGAENIHYKDQIQHHLQGINYCLLRREYLTYPQTETSYASNKKNNILVTLGGADPFNITSLMIESLAQLDENQSQIKVIVGPANNRMPEYIHLLPSQKNIELIANPENMPALMDWADIAVLCAGGTLWECMFMGCAVLSTSINQIQHSILSNLHDKKYIKYLGEKQNLTKSHITTAVKQLLNNPGQREEYSKKSRQLVDGKGARRLLKAMLKKETTH